MALPRDERNLGYLMVVLVSVALLALFAYGVGVELGR
jgi:hypothetical protein